MQIDQRLIGELPFVRLFLSVDVVGSTALKYQDSNLKSPIESWVRKIQEFYEKFVQELNVYYASKRIKPPDLWKYLGDELIFEVKLNSWTEARKHLLAFKETVIKRSTAELPLKATAWAAGFPVRNALYQNSQNALTDYIGPEMDKGFRISQYASPYRFVIAADLAYGLLSHRSFLNQRWHYHGRFPLNGVREISGYPIISLELQPDPISDAEETLLGEAVTGKKIRTFLQQFVKEAQSTIELAIIDDPSDHPDPKYEEQFNKAMVAYRDRASQDAGESETPNLSIPDPMLSPR